MRNYRKGITKIILALIQFNKNQGMPFTTTAQIQKELNAKRGDQSIDNLLNQLKNQDLIKRVGWGKWTTTNKTKKYITAEIPKTKYVHEWYKDVNPIEGVDYVVCPICKQYFRALNLHLTQKHHISKEELNDYAVKHNIKLFCDNYRKK